jgi:c(7)-type cytochrome triheme protein
MKKTFLCVLAVCLACASVAGAVVGGGDITFSVKGADSAVYSHEFHVKTAKLKCSNCHYKIYRMSRSSKKLTMADMQKGMSCGACHNGTRAFDIESNCAKCHK